MPLELIAGLGTALISFMGKTMANNTASLTAIAELQIKKQMTADQLANSAAKRSNPTARKVLAYLIIGTFVCGLLVVGIIGIWNQNAVVSLVTEGHPKSLLWGLFKWGGGQEVTVAHGFVLPPWTGWVVSVVIGFFFGTGTAKGKS